MNTSTSPCAAIAPTKSESLPGVLLIRHLLVLFVTGWF